MIDCFEFRLTVTNLQTDKFVDNMCEKGTK
jgi:hypothetical protein